MSQTKPHLVRATIGKYGLNWSIECPYTSADEGRPCTLWMECEHSRPEPPDNGMDEPKYLGDRQWDWTGYSDAQRLEWEAYQQADDDWDDSHPHGSWDKVAGCWAQDYMGSQASFEECLDDLPEDVEMTLPFLVEVQADGGHMDDAHLILRPWKSDTPAAVLVSTPLVADADVGRVEQ